MGCCRKCGAIMLNGSKFCEKCGARIEEEKTIVEMKEPKAEEILRCENCGFLLKQGETVCSNCGNVITNVSSGQSDQFSQSKEALINDNSKDDSVTSGFVIPDGAKCRYCNAAISKETGECVLCHKPYFDPPELPKEPEPKTVHTDMVIDPKRPITLNCKVCGGLISEETGKCKICNRPYEELTVKQGEIVSEEQISEVSLVYRKDQINLWSNLSKSFDRKMYYTDDKPANETIFMKKVQAKMQDNQVPATIVNANMYWDDDVSRKMSSYFIDIRNGLLSNPFSVLLKCKNVGKFTFVEKSTFITPPQLPQYPGEKTHLTSTDYSKQKFLWFGIGGILAAIYTGMSSIVMAAIFAIIGIVFAIIGGMATAYIKSSEEYNWKVDKQIDAWNDAWHSWETNKLRHAYQEVTGGDLSRIFEAVFACVDQTCEEEFGSTSVREETGDMKINEIQSIVEEKRKKLRG